jgi:MoaA/NifB/PqqE/SkfB family radical SAM enzyme
VADAARNAAAAAAHSNRGTRHTTSLATASTLSLPFTQMAYAAQSRGDLGAAIRYLEQSVKLSINPLAMKDRVIDALIQSPPSYLMIALDGHDDASFERIRGVPDAYDFSVERLHVYLARKVAAKVPTFVELGMIDFVENENSLHLLRDRWNGVKGIDNVTAKRFITWDGSAEEINAYAPQPMTNEEARKHFPVPSCHLPWETVSITWDGSVVPCCYDYDRKIVLGLGGSSSRMIRSTSSNGDKS